MINLVSDKDKNMNWESIIHNLNEGGGTVKIQMGSPGSAQVTRCRLMDAYDGLYANTHGDPIFLEVA